MKNKENRLIRVNRLNNLGIKADASRKVKLFWDAVELVSEYFELKEEDYKPFADNFRTYTCNKLREKSGGLMDHFSDEKIADFYCFPMSVLNEIQNRYLSLRQIKLSEDFKTALIPDNAIFTSNEQENERLSDLEQLIEAVEKIRKNRIHIDYYGLSRALGGVVIAQGKRLDANERYVKGKL